MSWEGATATDPTGRVVGASFDGRMVALPQSHSIEARAPSPSPRTGAWTLNVRTGLVELSEGAARLHGIPATAFSGRLSDFAALITPEDRPSVHFALRQALSDDEPLSVEYRVAGDEGAPRWLQLSGARWTEGLLQCVVTDLTERRRADAQALRSAAWFRELVQQSRDPLLAIDGDGAIRYASPAIERLLGRTADGLLGSAFASIAVPRLARTAMRFVQAALQADAAPIEEVLRCPHVDGRTRDVRFTAAPLRGWPGVQGAVVSAHDVTAERDVAARLARQINHDPLTDLPNRTSFTAWMAGTTEGRGRERSLAVLLIDLDRFKAVNGSLGHGAGDRLLVEVGKRLRECLGAEAMLARLGGDEFAVGLGGVDDAAALAAAERVIECLAPPIPIEGREVCTGASVGIAVGDARRSAAGDMLREAEVALYRAKLQGRGRALLYRPDMTIEPPVWFELEADLRRAVERNELRLHYQPLMLSTNRHVVAIEALLRWQHPTRGLVPPMDFISLAEETGLIVPIGEWLIGEACRQMVAWCAADTHGLLEAIHVNVSSRQLQHPGFATTVEQALRASGLPPERMRLEVTERVLVDEVRSEAGTLTALRRLGIRLAIDDFGAGASSLAHLRELQADVLKLDRSLVHRLDIDLGDRAVVRAITALAHAFDMRVVAEGIETAAQLASVVAVGCDWGQGFLFGAPRSARELAVFLDEANGTLTGDLSGGRNEPGASTRELAAILGLAHTGMLNPLRVDEEAKR